MFWGKIGAVGRGGVEDSGNGTNGLSSSRQTMHTMEKQRDDGSDLLIRHKAKTAPHSSDHQNDDNCDYGKK